MSSVPPSVGPQIPPHLLSTRSTTPPKDLADDNDDDDEDAYLPALPPDLAAAPKRTLGPTLPTHASQTRLYDADDASDSDEVGPMPAPATGAQANSADDAVREFMEREERRRKADEEARQPKKLQREEWMLVPPSSSSVLGCTFHIVTRSLMFFSL